MKNHKTTKKVLSEIDQLFKLGMILTHTYVFSIMIIQHISLCT